MAEYDFNQLYTWLQEESRTLNWGMISFMDREKLNLLLLQAYICRFKTSAYLPPITGSIPNGDDRRFALNQFTLDWPRLSFAGGQSNDSKARLHMQVMAGTQLGLRKAGQDWEVREIRETSPLQGPELSLDLLLDKVPGVVGEEGRLRLDLKQSADFKMEVSDDPGEQRLVGEYFKQKFEALPDEQRVFPLGQIEAGVNPLLRAQSFALRTQARGRDQDDDEGAVLALVRYEGAEEGNIPGQDFRYLVPRDRAHDATVLFEPRRIMLAQLLESLKTIVNDVEFELEHDDQGKLIAAVAKRGTMVVCEQETEHRFDTQPDEFDRILHMILKFKIHELVMSLADAFRVSMDDKGVNITWRITGIMAMEPFDLDSENGEIGEMLRMVPFDTSKFYSRSEDDFIYEFTSSYVLEDVDGGLLKFNTSEMKEIKAPVLSIGEIGPPDGTQLDPLTRFFMAFIPVLTLLTKAIAEQVADALMNAVEGSDMPSVESVVRDALGKNFEFSQSLRDLVNETIKLNFGNALIGQAQFAPRDVAFFGAVNPAFTAFAIDPMEHTLVAGSSPKQFTTAPAHLGKLRWTCEPVLDTVASGQIGSIDENTGMYTPPSGSAFEDAFIRVRIHAEHKDSPFSSSALVTIVKSHVQINPLAYVTQVNSPVTLQAGYLGDDKDLTWSSPQYGELMPSGKTAVYTAPAAMPPLDPSDPEELAAFVVDEVALGDGTGKNSSQVALVIIESAIKQPMPIRRELGAVAGTVKLTAFINGKAQDPSKIVWKVKGSGAVDEVTGIYTHDPSSSDQFALITATFDTVTLGIYDGYVLQTLPPAELEDAVLGVGVFHVQKNQMEVKP
ncbi:hypothetical protein [Pseudomonas sp. NPDC090592]|uniref:hypothetical protein n=1 Tax=Pseudomonas sp. NPDC090592 TaxID=3364480 RepID=UPI00383A0139